MGNKYQSPICKTCNSIIKIIRPRDRFKEYCNRKCVAIAQALTIKMTKDIQCKYCKQTFSQKNIKQTYCSNTCRSNDSKIVHIRKCIHCGDSFVLNNIAYERRGQGKYCSNKCATRKYELNTSYFNNIDTCDSAYWLGFLLADGYHNKYEIIINLQYNDIEHITKLKNALNFTGPIMKNISTIKYEHHSKEYDICTLRVGSIDMCNDLDTLGCVQAKSKIIQYPNIDEKYNNALIRGYFDGDGCISIHKTTSSKQYARVSMYSESTEFINKLHLILSNNNIKSNISNKGRVLSLSSRLAVISFYKFIYNEDVANMTYLDRKYNKFIEYFNYIEQC